MSNAALPSAPIAGQRAAGDTLALSSLSRIRRRRDRVVETGFRLIVGRDPIASVVALPAISPPFVSHFDFVQHAQRRRDRLVGLLAPLARRNVRRDREVDDQPARLPAG
jgi:hypothetical protein